ncbi:MAG: YceI family protein [Pseudomonadota bacterium]
MSQAFSKLNVLLASSLLLCTSAYAQFGVPSGAYELDNTHAYITFSYSHLGFSNPHVGFNSFTVDVNADNENPQNSQVAVVIDADSIDSRVAEFDQHLVGENYFDTAQYPEITFTSTSIKQTADNTFDVTGNLTIKDITKPVTLATTINKAAEHPMLKIPNIGLSATTTVSRTEFGLGRFAPAVGDEVTIFITAELFKKAE